VGKDADIYVPTGKRKGKEKFSEASLQVIDQVLLFQVNGHNMPLLFAA
jgi:hypothetical protein